MTDSRDRWAVYAKRVAASGPIKVAYDTWTHHVPTLGHLIKVAKPPQRVLSIGCGVGSDSAAGPNARQGIALASVGRD